MEPSETKNATLAMSKNKKKEKERRSEGEFEFCDVCKLNHDQGHHHKYFTGHRRALAAALARFHEKLADLRFFLRNPSPLRPEHSALNRLWCLFCAVDLRELGSPFACSNAIYHLASLEHLENIKGFLRKHGGEMDRVALFRVSEAELLKWEKGCELLKNAASSSSEGHIGPSPGPSKDIQYELTSNNMDNFQKNYKHTFSSTVSHTVMPLQSLTNEGYRACPPEFSGTTGAGSIPYVATPLAVGALQNVGLQDMHAMGNVGHLTGSQATPIRNKGKGSVGLSFGNRVDQRSDFRGDCTGVLQTLTQVSFPSGGCQANVHTGAPPPWFETSEEHEKSLTYKGLHMDKKLGKSRKLNPKRVGAAWAEKRRIELEMEKRGEVVAKSWDANWLPNFGRVWQKGTRKESRKEFEIEKRKFFKNENQSESPLKIQPYISKRMRMSSNTDGAANGHVEEYTNICDT
ncbi:TITAN-like protein [Phoenix dactylifera]|uniref:TITAN-like protein n=1 Tax=Phoenix dactylifera TaxID=42345 RepID=A0A8B8IZB9_PHODC|nr:TITAN-like protein [Phoenix dactylifera]XP_026656169.1 TITAN-like protein [Phoenix dactylifera]XP_026656170.1 TITAN-like protein [Phoenix dactylifera]